MKARYILLVGVAILALAPVIGFLARHRAPDGGPETRLPTAIGARPAARAPGASVEAERGPDLAPDSARRIVAAELRMLAGASLPASVREQLAAGDVRGAAAALAAAGRAGASSLYQLALACRAAASPEGAKEREREDERALGELRGDAALHAALEPLAAARANFAERFAKGCAEVSLAPDDLRAGLREAADAGDGDALVQLARTAASEAEGTRLRQSAALLGSAQAQLELALPVLFAPTGRATDEARREALLWMRQAAHGLPWAETLAADCLRTGCAGGPADVAAARAGYERAARRGDLAALAVLGDETRIAGGSVAVLRPPDVPDLGLAPPERYAYAAFAARLAREGCVLDADDALPVAVLIAAQRLGAALKPSELEEAQARAAALWAEAGENARGERGCE